MDNKVLLLLLLFVAISEERCFTNVLIKSLPVATLRSQPSGRAAVNSTRERRQRGGGVARLRPHVHHTAKLRPPAARIRLLWGWLDP